MRRAWWFASVVCVLVGVSAQAWACSSGAGYGEVLWPTTERGLEVEGEAIWLNVSGHTLPFEATLRGDEGTIPLRAQWYPAWASPDVPPLGSGLMALWPEQRLLPDKTYSLVIEGEVFPRKRTIHTADRAERLEAPTPPAVEYHFDYNPFVLWSNEPCPHGSRYRIEPPAHRNPALVGAARLYTIEFFQGPSAAAPSLTFYRHSLGGQEKLRIWRFSDMRAYGIPCVRMSATDPWGRTARSEMECAPVDCSYSYSERPCEHALWPFLSGQSPPPAFGVSHRAQDALAQASFVKARSAHRGSLCVGASARAVGREGLERLR